jgi:hypothetical protein
MLLLYCSLTLFSLCCFVMNCSTYHYTSAPVAALVTMFSPPFPLLPFYMLLLLPTHFIFNAPPTSRPGIPMPAAAANKAEASNESIDNSVRIHSHSSVRAATACGCSE